MTAFTSVGRRQTSPARARHRHRIVAAALMLYLLGALACGTTGTTQTAQMRGEATAIAGLSFPGV